ncbi:hypothetical protein HHK36_000538 [Tetracentron sinense]|uniref:Uncharacterized protein n=1 Tax=Tetracentron sinense TaxID=13715 RepID=A0A834ZRR4_TETSI|nr:hypothetical protein HHK36_000538 [Tetracentron sinense]
MQRQSLGSPGSKLHSHGGGGGGGGGGKEEKLGEEEQKRKDGGASLTEKEEEIKTEKLHRSSSRTEKSIHLIPILTIFCLLVLYLCSYDPPPKDLANFNGFRLPSTPIDSTEISKFGRFLEVEKGDVLATQSHRSLQEVGKDVRKPRFHRKIGDF